MFNNNQNNQIAKLFGKAICDHKITVFIPKKLGKEDSHAICARLYSLFVDWFNAAQTQESIMSFQDNKKERRDDHVLIVSYFNDSQLKYLPDVVAFIKATCIMFNQQGILVDIDGSMYFVKE